MLLESCLFLTSVTFQKGHKNDSESALLTKALLLLLLEGTHGDFGCCMECPGTWLCFWRHSSLYLSCKSVKRILLSEIERKQKRDHFAWLAILFHFLHRVLRSSSFSGNGLLLVRKKASQTKPPTSCHLSAKGKETADLKTVYLTIITTIIAVACHHHHHNNTEPAPEVQLTCKADLGQKIQRSFPSPFITPTQGITRLKWLGLTWKPLSG